MPAILELLALFDTGTAPTLRRESGPKDAAGREREALHKLLTQRLRLCGNGFSFRFELALCRNR